jgi:hypothetical protein
VGPLYSGRKYIVAKEGSAGTQGTGEFEPEPIDRLKARFSQSLDPLYNDGDFSTPGKNRQHVFDVVAGMLLLRFIVARVIIETKRQGQRHAVVVGVSEPSRLGLLTGAAGQVEAESVFLKIAGDVLPTDALFVEFVDGVHFYYFIPPPQFTAPVPPIAEKD